MYQGKLGKDRGKRDCHILNSCGDPSEVEEPVCNRFAVINKGVPEYQKIALPWWNNWCQKQHSTGAGTIELARYGCFDKNMEADGYEHTQGFYQQYIESLGVFVADDKYARKFCTNQNVIDKGWCGDTLEKQCTKDPRYKDKDECSCYHYMNDGGIGYKNFKAQGIDYEAYKQMVPDPSKADDIAGRMDAEFAPMCELIKCTKKGWKTKKLNETRCKPCSQVNYNAGKGSSTQKNTCVIKYIDGKFVVDPPPKPKPDGSSVDPAPEPKERSSVQVSKGCNKFRKGPECKKLSGLSVGLIVSSTVILFFLLMLFLFF